MIHSIEFWRIMSHLLKHQKYEKKSSFYSSILREKTKCMHFLNVLEDFKDLFITESFSKSVNAAYKVKHLNLSDEMDLMRKLERFCKNAMLDSRKFMTLSTEVNLFFYVQ